MKRNKILSEILSDIELTDTERKNASSKYEAVGSYLSKSLGVIVYPQGSFATNTIIRPYNKADKKVYDLDAMVQFPFDKTDVSPKFIKQSLKNSLETHGIYKEKLNQEESDKCWTLNFAEVGNDTYFSMDLVPSILEDEISRFLNDSDYSDSLGFITSRNQMGEYNWVGNNSIGFSKWFIEQGKIIGEKLYKLSEKNISATVEPLRTRTISTTLSRIVKILKRHRDIYYNKNEIEDFKPASSIILASVGKVSELIETADDELSLLKQIVTILQLSNSLTFKGSENLYRYKEISNIISRENDIWVLKNPADSRDNLLDSWNSEHGNIISDYFFQWLHSLDEVLDELSDNMRLNSKNFVLSEHFKLNVEGRTEIPEYNVGQEVVKPWLKK